MNTIVGVIMGPNLDWKIMEGAVATLDEFGVAYEVGVVSAYRMPEDMVEYGHKASERGLRAIIVSAGDAAHPPGMLAASTPLPAIGVPVPLRHFDGMDSLLSIVQMPAGVPVVTVLITGARSAGPLAAYVIGSAPTDRDVRDRMATFQDGLRETAKAKGAALRGKLGD